MAPRHSSTDGGSDGGILKAAARFWRRSYAPDYAGLAVLVTSYLAIALFVEPFHRMFSLGDLAISFPHAEHERVPVTMNVVYAAAVPLAVVVATNLAAGSAGHKHHVAVLGLAIAVMLATLLTDIVKNAVGRPRPDLLARCKPRPGTPAGVLVDWTVCTETQHHLLHDGWRSFPSGHSSFSFAGLGYTALFLAGQLRVFAYRRHDDDDDGGGGDGGGGNGKASNTAGRMERVVQAGGGHDLGRALLCMAPLLGATMIAISRCQDYRHDVYDVCTGSLLGWTVAYWSYRRYWPRLGSPRCSEPYSSPGSGADEAARRYGRLRDEEDGRAGAYEMRNLNR